MGGVNETPKMNIELAGFFLAPTLYFHRDVVKLVTNLSQRLNKQTCLILQESF